MPQFQKVSSESTERQTDSPFHAFSAVWKDEKDNLIAKSNDKLSFRSRTKIIGTFTTEEVLGAGYLKVTTEVKSS